MFGLSFLSPLFLAALGAVAIPVLLHLFRRRTEVVVDFPAVRLIRKTPVEQQRRRRLRELVLLALRVTALALLALAFARPYLRDTAAAAPAPVTVVALDTSLSLSAPGQIERARALAREAVDAAPATHLVALVTFNDAATLVVPPTTDRGGVRAAIDQTAATAGGTRYRTMLARAADAVSSGQGQLVVVTDRQQAGWDAADEGAVPEGIALTVAAVEAPAGNLAVTDARRDGDGVVNAGIHNFGGARVTTRVVLEVEGRVLASESVDLEPQAATTIRLAAALPAAGGAVVRIDDATGYALDNTRYLVLNPPSAVPILVITSDPPASSDAGLYVERALSVADDGRAFAVRVLDGRAFSQLTAAEFGTPGGLMVLGTTTLDRPGRARIALFLREGGRVLLTLGPGLDVATLEDTVGVALNVSPDPVATDGRTVTIVAVDGRHPIFRPFLAPGGALGDVYVDRVRRLNDQPGQTVLARFSGGAGNALVEQTVGAGRLLVFGSDLDNAWNRFPLNPAFVPWTIETARYLSQGRESRQGYTLPDVPSGVALTPGVHQAGDRAVAINADVRESNPAMMAPEAFDASVTRLAPVTAARAHAEARETEERQRLWQVGLIVMLVALAGEGLIGRKAV